MMGLRRTVQSQPFHNGSEGEGHVLQLTHPDLPKHQSLPLLHHYQTITALSDICDLYYKV